jgi:hypothetical protein
MRLQIRDSGIFLTLDPGWKKFVSGMEKIRIRDKHPGSATLANSLFKVSVKNAKIFLISLSPCYRWRSFEELP